MSSDKIIAVTSATGQQGNAAARHLLAQGWKVRALPCHPNKPAMQALAAAGAEVLPCSMDNRTELDEAFKGA